MLALLGMMAYQRIFVFFRGNYVTTCSAPSFPWNNVLSFKPFCKTFSQLLNCVSQKLHCSYSNCSYANSVDDV